MRIDGQCDITFVCWNFYRPTIFYICDIITANDSFIDGFFCICHIVSSEGASVVLIFLSEIFLARPVPMVVADSAMIYVKSLWEPALWISSGICSMRRLPKSLRKVFYMKLLPKDIIFITKYSWDRQSCKRNSLRASNIIAFCVGCQRTFSFELE